MEDLDTGLRQGKLQPTHDHQDTVRRVEDLGAGLRHEEARHDLVTDAQLEEAMAWKQD